MGPRSNGPNRSKRFFMSYQGESFLIVDLYEERQTANESEETQVISPHQHPQRLKEKAAILLLLRIQRHLDALALTA